MPANNMEKETASYHRYEAVVVIAVGNHKLSGFPKLGQGIEVGQGVIEGVDRLVHILFGNKQ